MGKRMWTTADIRELRRRRWAPEFATRRTLAEAFGVSLSSIDHALYVNGITVEKLRGKQRGGRPLIAAQQPLIRQAIELVSTTGMFYPEVAEKVGWRWGSDRARHLRHSVVRYCIRESLPVPRRVRA